MRISVLRIHMSVCSEHFTSDTLHSCSEIPGRISLGPQNPSRWGYFEGTADILGWRPYTQAVTDGPCTFPSVIQYFHITFLQLPFLLKISVEFDCVGLNVRQVRWSTFTWSRCHDINRKQALV